jgi:molybdopterin converting factor small subunit
MTAVGRTWSAQRNECAPPVLLFVDERSSESLPDDMDAEVHGGQTIEFLPPVGGG